MKHWAKLSIISAFLCLLLSAAAWTSTITDCNDVYEYRFNYESDFDGDCDVDACDLDYITDNWLYDYAPDYEPPPGPPFSQCIKTLWVDGVKQSPLGATDVLSQEYDRLTIGANGNYQNRLEGLIGQIDEFAIYHGVLSDPCIAWHASFNQGDANYVTAVQSDSPLLYFRFEDASSNNGDPVTNIGSTPRAGTYIGDDVIGEPNLVSGYIGNCVEFYGAKDGNGTCIDVCDWDGAFFPADGNLTVEFWLNVPTPNHQESRWWFQHTDTYGQNGYGGMIQYHLVEEGPPVIDFRYNYLRGGGSSGFVEVNTCEQWRHIVVTFESRLPTGPLLYPDTVREDDPCLWIRFENGDACDWSGHEYWVEYGSNTTIGYVGGGIGDCIYLPGTAIGSYITAANQGTEPSDDPCFGHQYAFTPGDTTWEFWYRGQELPELDFNTVFFQQSWGDSNDDDYRSPALLMDGGGPGFRYVRYPYNHPDGYWGYANQDPAMAIPLDDKWHHIVMSWKEMINDANRMDFRLCIDGQAVKGPVTYPDTSPESGLVGANRGEMDHIVIGGSNGRDWVGTDGRLIGYIDEFAIYSGVLPMDRVVAHYDAWQPRNCQELWDRGMAEEWEGIDRNENCLIEFIDFAWFAQQWLLCNDPAIGPPDCPPNWLE